MAFARTNISVICREGAEAFATKKSMGVLMPSVAKTSISMNISSPLLKNKNPKKMITVTSGISNVGDCTVAISSSSASTDVAFEEEPELIAVENSSDSNSIAVLENAVQKSSIENKNSKYKRRRSLVRVRFTPRTATDPELISKQKNKHTIKKKKRKSPSESPPESSATVDCDCDCDSVLWWTKEELKAIHLSCVYAIKSCEYSSTPTSNNDCDGVATETTTDLLDASCLDRFSSRNCKRRKLVQWQMYETTKAVRDFESATKTKAPEEMLPQLLYAYSKPMELEAVESALRMRLQLHTATASTTISGTTKKKTLSDERDAAMVCAQRFLSRSTEKRSERTLQDQRQCQQEQQRYQSSRPCLRPSFLTPPYSSY